MNIYRIFSGVELLIKKEIMYLYLGPGLGGGILAVISGFLLTIFAFLVAVFWIPLKRFFRFLTGKNKK